MKKGWFLNKLNNNSIYICVTSTHTHINYFENRFIHQDCISNIKNKNHETINQTSISYNLRKI